MPTIDHAKATKDAKISRYRVSSPSGADMPSWGDVPAELLHRLITLATSAGDAVSFSKASEGEQLLLTVFSSGERDRLFWNDASEATAAVSASCDSLEKYLKKAGSVNEKASARKYLD